MRLLPKDIPTSEEWLPIVGFELLYLISRWGQVYSIETDTFLKPGMSNSGYFYVVLCKDGVHYTRYVHRLVAEAFLGPCPPGKEVNHKDSNPSNNCLSNLEYVTRSENNKHAYVNGRVPINTIGENNGKTSFRDKDIPAIRKRAEDGETQKAIADDYGVHRVTINLIVNRKTWAHVV